MSQIVSAEQFLWASPAGVLYFPLTPALRAIDVTNATWALTLRAASLTSDLRVRVVHQFAGANRVWTTPVALGNWQTVTAADVDLNATTVFNISGTAVATLNRNVRFGLWSERTAGSGLAYFFAQLSVDYRT